MRGKNCNFNVLTPILMAYIIHIRKDFLSALTCTVPSRVVLTVIMCPQVLIDPASKRAYGVEFMRDERIFRIRAKKEVILSAGAINSPQILMLSGVGPQEHLSKLGNYRIAHLLFYIVIKGELRKGRTCTFGKV